MQIPNKTKVLDEFLFHVVSQVDGALDRLVRELMTPMDSSADSRKSLRVFKRDNGRDHRTAAKDIVSKSRAARGSVLLSRDVRVEYQVVILPLQGNDA